MKKNIFIWFLLLFACNSLVIAQDEEYDNAADSIYLKCLYEYKHFISINTLQYIVGTANINYEFFFTNRVSVKIGGGTGLGYRIMVNDYENCVPGGKYYTIEPRWYSYASTKNCWMQFGVAVGYKYWEYQRNEIINPNAPDGTPYIYKKTDEVQQLGFISVVGKHPVAAGFTFEYQAGVGAGPKNGAFYVTPNVGFSVGWTL